MISGSSADMLILPQRTVSVQWKKWRELIAQGSHATKTRGLPAQLHIEVQEGGW